MSVVSHIKCAVVTLPLARPVELATRRVSSRQWLIVKIVTDDGLEGFGFSYAGYEGGAVAAPVVNEIIAPHVIGQQSIDPQSLWDRLYRATAAQGRGGLVMRGLSAVDIALWDRNAKAANLPLHAWLGTASARAVPVVICAGYYGRDHDAELAEMSHLRASGYEAVKVKVGKLEAAREGARVAGFRRVLGDGVHLAADANGGWDLTSAAHAIGALRNAGVQSVEDPLPPSELVAWQALRRDCALEISGGELFGSPFEFETALALGALDVLQVDATACGGVTGFLRVAALAEREGRSIETHWFPDLHVHLALCSPAVRRVEVFADDDIINFPQIAASRAALGSLGAAPSARPGHGLSIDARWFD